MTKSIVFAVMCTLLVLVIVMSGIVFYRFSPMLESLRAPADPTGQTQTTAPSATNPPATQTTVPTETTSPPVTVAPTEPTQITIPTEPGHEHAFVKTRTVEPTCTSYGYTLYTCDCGKTEIPDDEFVNPVGHNYVAGDPVKATCTTAPERWKAIRLTAAHTGAARRSFLCCCRRNIPSGSMTMLACLPKPAIGWCILLIRMSICCLKAAKAWLRCITVLLSII